MTMIWCYALCNKNNNTLKIYLFVKLYIVMVKKNMITCHQQFNITTKHVIGVNIIQSL